MVGVVHAYFADEGRPGADQGHVALQYIPELREFVDTAGAQEMSEAVFGAVGAAADDAGIVFDLEHLAFHFVFFH